MPETIDDPGQLARRVSGLAAAPANRDAVIADLRDLVAGLRTENAVQAARIAELERRLGPGSFNSGRPPPGDGLAKPTAEELRERQRSRRRESGRTPGGQRGHACGTLSRRATPDRVEGHHPAIRSGCGGALDAGMSAGFAARQVHDLPEPPPPGVTGHRVRRCVRPACGAETRADFPEGVTAPAIHGPRPAALAVYPDAARHVRDAVAQAPGRHMDGTGIRVRGRLAWPHVACTGRPSHFRVGAGRGDVMADATGIAVHDHWRPYSDIPGTVPPLCAAHVLRELQDRVDFDGEAWAERTARLLRRAVHAGSLSEGKPLPERLADLIGRRYDGIVAEGIAMHGALPPPAPPGRRGRRSDDGGATTWPCGCGTTGTACRGSPATPRFRPPTTRQSGRRRPSRCGRGSPGACAARREPGTTRRRGNRDLTCWRPCGPRRKSWSRGSSRDSRPRRAEPPAGREAARTEPEQLHFVKDGRC